MQIVKAYNKEIISEVASMCGDPEYRDYKREFYGQAIYRAMRRIAKDYNLTEYALFLTVEDFEVDLWLSLPLSNFRGEIEVRVNDKPYLKTNDDPKNEYEYVIKYSNDSLVLNYYNKVAKDKVYIKYSSLGQKADEFDGTPLIPDRFYEELLNKAIVYLAKIGVAQFTAEKKEKYLTLLKIYDTPHDDYDPHLAKNNQWIVIKPFDIFGEYVPDERLVTPITSAPERGLYG